MSDEHKWRRKCFVICLLALFIGLIGIVLPEQFDIAYQPVVNNTDLYNNGRITGVNYTANDSSIDLYLIFHVVGTGAAFEVDTNLSVNGTVLQDHDYRTTAGVGIHEHFPLSATIPRGAVYKVTNSSNLETIEWREYPILTGRNGTLSINMTGGAGTGSQNLSQVLTQGYDATTQGISNLSNITGKNGMNLNITGFDQVNMDQSVSFGRNILKNVSEINFDSADYNNNLLGRYSAISFPYQQSGSTPPTFNFYFRTVSRVWDRGTNNFINGSNPELMGSYDSLGNGNFQVGSFPANSTTKHLDFDVSAGSSMVTVRSPLNITIESLAGTGNAYVCVDANGKLYRGNPTC